ncbi:uncharacterized protein C8Q71DRAFT_856076 [Rhodofomes roseus]|uniref:Uncharacterized protein n=1 Tax=Rhodofomes roseus TaxID=34475 RepID=A0ABQ8KML8_9APHY|nr:uncharacterized protein C8Q71DRAFT_856076 [Rhodofomes roseus]KAH9839461.1 hypothetical protein C8Q71DRAFT_856076 [Rhodofomes roseus]
MVGKGKDTARDPPNPTPAFNVDMLQQMIAALQLVVDRDEDRRLWDAVGPPPPEPTISSDYEDMGGADNQVQPGASMQQGTLPTSSQPACDPAAVAQLAPVLARSASPSPTPHAQPQHLTIAAVLMTMVTATTMTWMTAMASAVGTMGVADVAGVGQVAGPADTADMATADTTDMDTADTADTAVTVGLVGAVDKAGAAGAEGMAGMMAKVLAIPRVLGLEPATTP